MSEGATKQDWENMEALMGSFTGAVSARKKSHNATEDDAMSALLNLTVQLADKTGMPFGDVVTYLVEANRTWQDAKREPLVVDGTKH